MACSTQDGSNDIAARPAFLQAAYDCRHGGRLPSPPPQSPPASRRLDGLTLPAA